MQFGNDRRVSGPHDERLTTRLRIAFHDGSSREVTVRHPRGTGDNALSNAEIVAKYRTLTEGCVDTDRRDAISRPYSASPSSTTLRT